METALLVRGGCGWGGAGTRPTLAPGWWMRRHGPLVTALLIGGVVAAAEGMAAEPPPAVVESGPVTPVEDAAAAVDGATTTAASTPPVDGAPRPPARGTASLGPLLLDEILHRYDLNGDGTVDDVEASLGQSKLRHYRQAFRAARDVDPVTGHPRSESDPTTRSGRRAGDPGAANETVPGLPRRDAPGGDPLHGASRWGIGAPRSGSPSEPRATGTSNARRERILSILTSPPGATGPSTVAGGAVTRPPSPSSNRSPSSSAGRDRQVTGGGRAEPFGWAPGGNGTLFRGGSYPLPDRGGGRNGSAAPRAGGQGAGALLPGASGSAASGSRSGSPSRATVPPSSRGPGGRPSGPSSAPPPRR